MRSVSLMATLGVAAMASFIQPSMAQEPIRIGVMFPVTGPISAQGKPERDAVKLAFDEENNVIAGRKVELLFEDSAGRPDTGLTKVKALVERDKEYMEAARVLGLSRTRQVLNHLLPNCLPPLIVVATVQLAHAISLEATLSFFGLGLPITEPSLGLLIANGFNHLMSGRYWISFYPGLALLITIVSINLVADQLREILNPRQGK